MATAPIDLDAETPSVGPWTVRIRDAHNDIYHIDWSPDSRFVAFSRGPESQGDLSKAGSFQRPAACVGVYAKDWNICVAAADRPGNLDLATAGPADFLQLTTNGASNKEPAWYWAQC